MLTLHVLWPSAATQLSNLAADYEREPAEHSLPLLVLDLWFLGEPDGANVKLWKIPFHL